MGPNGPGSRKRARAENDAANGHMTPPGGGPLPPLSHSILGTEPLEDFVREVADFVHSMIMRRPDVQGKIEVEAKVGVLRERNSAARASLPVLTETGAYDSCSFGSALPTVMRQ
jgi:polynucleotide 5'-triphosphatase